MRVGDFRQVFVKVLIVLGGAAALLALFGVDAFGLGPVKLGAMGTVLLAVALLVATP